MITQNMIEDGVIKYIRDKGSNPKYVLMDKNSYDDFNKSFRPIEKLKIKPLDENHKVSKMVATRDCSVDILSVDIDKEMFEVVG